MRVRHYSIIFLESAIQQFRDYKLLAEKAFAQLVEKDFHFQPNDETNSIAINITHLYGNMMSRWTNFLTEDGEKEWRQRDDEFEVHSYSKQQLIDMWKKGWTCFFNAIEPLQEDDFLKTVYIRKEPLSVIDAINRQLAHYPYHIGQMVFYAKMLKHGDWDSLSIPKNKSGDYNSDKFSQEKSIRNFTDDELNKLK